MFYFLRSSCHGWLHWRTWHWTRTVAVLASTRGGGGRILCSKVVVDDLHRTEKGSTRRVGFEPLHFLSSFTSLCSLPCVAAPSPGNLYPNDRMTDKILQRGSVHPKFQVDEFATTNHSFSQKTRLSDLLYGTKIWTDLSSFLPQSTRLTDRQTHRQNSHR